MSPDVFAYFGLSENPFSKEIADTDLWLPPSKQAVLDELVDAAGSRKCVMLTGEPGVGKTCLLRALRHTLAQDQYRLSYACNTTLGRRDFYRHLCFALGIPRGHNYAGDVFHSITSHVEELATQRLCPVFVIDESHLLHQDMLDHLHILLNYAWDSKALLSIMLLGLPELEERLRLRRNRSLFSRIHCRLALGTLEPEDTADYLTCRLARVGGAKDLFAPEAVALLHEAASGSLRDLDRLASSCMRIAAKRKRKTIERNHAAHALKSEGEPLR